MSKIKDNKEQKRASSLFILILFLGFLFLPKISWAANHYIRDGTTGSAPCAAGWGDTQSCDALPATLIRGDTYYIADGSYGSYAFDDAEVGATYIYIKKATIADHGTNTGWLDSYGDGQALFSGGANSISFISSNWALDGNTPYGTYRVFSCRFKCYYAKSGL